MFPTVVVATTLICGAKTAETDTQVAGLRWRRLKYFLVAPARHSSQATSALVYSQLSARAVQRTAFDCEFCFVADNCEL